MDVLLLKSIKKIKNVSVSITRYLLSEINRNNRLIVIKGARGVGKTTLLLQYAKLFLPENNKTLYVSLDDLFFNNNTLYSLAEQFEKNNGQFLLLDEVHKYPDWSREIKLIYDDFPNLKIIVTSSSILEIYKSESDLSRRAISYTLKELSFREYLQFENGLSIDKIELDDIIANHVEIAFSITQKIKPIYEFNNYLKKGIYPYYWEDKEDYYSKLLQTINLILEIDLPAIENIDYNHIVKIKRLLFAISTSVSFTPNISKLSEKTEMSRQSLIRALHYLERARLIIMLQKNNKGISILSKPEKIYMNNSNLLYALSEKNANVGNIRETFFANQLIDLFKVNIPDKGDFIINDTYLFEIGGKNKGQKQIKDIENAFIVKDDIENGINNIIPLWLFGFLY